MNRAGIGRRSGRAGGGIGRAGALGLLALVGAGAAGPGAVEAQERGPRATPDVTVRAVPADAGWLGIGVRMVSDGSEARENGRRVEGVTIIIADIMDGSAAEEAGLAAGDTLVRINDRRADARAFDELARNLKSGDRVKLTVVRDGRDRDFELIAKRRPRTAGIPWAAMPGMEIQIDSVRNVIFRNMDSLRAAFGEGGERQMILRFHLDSLRAAEAILRGSEEAMRGAEEGMRAAREAIRAQGFRFDTIQRRALEAAHGADAVWFSRPGAEGWSYAFGGRDGAMAFSPVIIGQRVVAGAQMIDMNPGLADYFDVKDGGVLVTEVIEGSPAHDSGMRAGDVITRMNDRPVRALSDVREGLGAARERPTRMQVVRKGERLTLTIPQ